MKQVGLYFVFLFLFLLNCLISILSHINLMTFFFVHIFSKLLGEPRSNS